MSHSQICYLNDEQSLSTYIESYKRYARMFAIARTDDNTYFTIKAWVAKNAVLIHLLTNTLIDTADSLELSGFDREYILHTFSSLAHVASINADREISHLRRL